MYYVIYYYMICFFFPNSNTGRKVSVFARASSRAGKKKTCIHLLLWSDEVQHAYAPPPVFRVLSQGTQFVWREGNWTLCYWRAAAGIWVELPNAATSVGPALSAIRQADFRSQRLTHRAARHRGSVPADSPPLPGEWTLVLNSH